MILDYSSFFPISLFCSAAGHHSAAHLKKVYLSGEGHRHRFSLIPPLSCDSVIVARMEEVLRD